MYERVLYKSTKYTQSLLMPSNKLNRTFKTVESLNIDWFSKIKFQIKYFSEI